MIVTLGKFASQAICRDNTPITRLRGNFRSYEGIPVMPTYHPAYLLRTPEAKREAWADLQAVIAALAKLGVQPPAPRR
jgi:DNA polymerase